MSDDRPSAGLGLYLVFGTLTCMGFLGLLVFVHTDFGLPTAAVTRRLFPEHFFVDGFGVDLRSYTAGFSAGFNLIVWTFAFAFPVVVWVVVAVRFVKRLNRWTYRSPASPGPVDSPPSPHDPAVVATLWGKGSPAPEAIAGTVLSLAALHRIEIQHLSGRSFALRVLPEATPGAPNDGEITPSQAIVLDALRRSVGPPPGEIDGPPLWKSPADWWPSLKTDARRRAVSAGLAVRGASSRLVLLATALTLIAFWLIKYVGSPFLFFWLAVLLPIVAGVATVRLGYGLTAEGRQLRGRWAEFASHLAQSNEVAEAPAAAVVILGPNLVYGTVLGVARDAARELTPEVPGR
jgi:hypothetical protein